MNDLVGPPAPEPVERVIMKVGPHVEVHVTGGEMPHSFYILRKPTFGLAAKITGAILRAVASEKLARAGYMGVAQFVAGAPPRPTDGVKP